MVPQKIFKFRVSEIFLAYSAIHFQKINTKENAVVVGCLFYSSLVLSVRWSILRKRVKHRGGGGGGTLHMKRVGMLVGNFEVNP